MFGRCYAITASERGQEGAESIDHEMLDVAGRDPESRNTQKINRAGFRVRAFSASRNDRKSLLSGNFAEGIGQGIVRQ
jgi:hypothetical protein